MSDISKFKKLSDRDHVLKRSSMYVSSTTPETITDWFIENNKIINKEVTVTPAFCTVFGEILYNSVDHSKREGTGKLLDTIKISVDRIFNTISIQDNGGIIVEQHPEYDNEWLPVMLFGSLKAGQNFDEDSDLNGVVGMNGVGSSLVNIFSKSFKVETADCHHSLSVEWKDNMETMSTPIVKKTKDHYTKITYQLDLERFGMKSIDMDAYSAILKLTQLTAILYPNLKFYFNGELLKYKGFEDLVKMGDGLAYYTKDHLQVGVGIAKEAFTQYSFVNGALTKNGGTHVDYVTNQIVASIREYVKKKTKIDLKPSDIKNRLSIFINCDVLIKKYTSQTKDCLVTPYSEIGYDFSLEGKFLKKIINSDICSAIIEWAQRKRDALDQAELEKANKELSKGSLRNIPKFHDAAEKKNRIKCTLIVTEGDSALSPVLGNLDRTLQGCFPLRGKPLNCHGRPLSKIKENEEIANLAKILGLEFGKPVNFDRLRFGRIVIASDSDMDGYAIQSLFISNIYQLWPELVENGMLYILRTPIIRVMQNKKDIDFMSIHEFTEWESKQKSKNYTIDYLKGLGSSDSKYFKKYLQEEQYFERVTWNPEIDKEYIELAFNSKNADKRKEWLAEA